MGFELDPSYKDVPARIADFKEKHPEGTLRAADPRNPYRIETIGSQTYIVYTAEAWRTPDDPAPGVGTAWEPVPGKTPYTKDSELQNAETSAWGRAIVAALASESKAVASAEDVRNRQADHAAEAEAAQQRELVAKAAGWKSTQERDKEWNRLADESKKLPADEQAQVKADIKKAGFTVADFTPENAKWWGELISLATPKGSAGDGKKPGDEAEVHPSSVDSSTEQRLPVG